MAIVISLVGGKKTIITLLDKKTGIEDGGDFFLAIGKRVFDVVFTTNFPNTNYSITMSGTKERSWSYSNKVVSGFRIISGAGSVLTGEEISWQAIQTGED